MTGAQVAEELTEMMLVKLSLHAQLMPGAFDAVNRVRTIMPVALVSASPRNLMDAALSTLPEDFFSFTISADDVKRTKPFPDPYLMAAEKMGQSPDQCVVFEDSPTGISSALEAGCAVIAVPHYVDVIEKNDLKVIDSLTLVDGPMLKDFYLGI
jgi:HAD superfamily hydrolase (TIGR01509 family)